MGCLGKITWRLDAQNRTNKQSEKNKEKSEAFGEDNKNFSFQHSHSQTKFEYMSHQVTRCEDMREWLDTYDTTCFACLS